LATAAARREICENSGGMEGRPLVNETTTNVQKPKEGMTFADFLQDNPPGSVADIADVLIHEQSGPRWDWLLRTPALRLHCESKQCEGVRFFRYVKGDRYLRGGEAKTYFEYVCSNCRKTKKYFSLLVTGEEGDEKGTCYKFGEYPAFGPPTPPRLLKMLDHDRELFMKGRRCESQSLGIAAFVYYRRVVENQRASIIAEIARVAKLINAPQETIELLKAAEAETQFSNSIRMIKDAIPESLKIQGHNPLTVLHDSLSSGLHAKSDAECLQIAQAIRIVLTDLAERLTLALKDEAEITKALGQLLKKN
jgi:hypothetical protein